MTDADVSAQGYDLGRAWRGGPLLPPMAWCSPLSAASAGEPRARHKPRRAAARPRYRRNMRLDVPVRSERERRQRYREAKLRARAERRRRLLGESAAA
jgi:hypothetical protein